MQAQHAITGIENQEPKPIISSRPNNPAYTPGPNSPQPAATETAKVNIKSKV